MLNASGVTVQFLVLERAGAAFIRAPSAEIEKKIDELLAVGLAADDPQGALSELAQFGAKLVTPRAVEDEVDAWLGQARHERKPDAAPGKRNGLRPRRL